MNRILQLCFVVLPTLLFLQSCGGGDSAPQITNQIEGKLYPAIIPNESTLPNTVEVTLTAAVSSVDYGTGIKTQVWAYNGIVPGPTIEAKVGDKVIVHLINKLPEDTTVHFHGVELPAVMDGSNISQLPIKPGETFTYNFTVTRAATYWYHPHVRSNVQVELGLHGAFVVRDPKEDKRLNLPTQEHLLLLDDVKLDEFGQVAKEFIEDPREKAEELLNGREGSIFLVNGKVNPRIRLQQGVPNRFRVINVSNSRFMRLSVVNHSLWLIGGDAGLISKRVKKSEIREIYNPRFRETEDQPEFYSDPDRETGIMLTPGERVEFIFTPNSAFDVISLNWHDTHRGKHIVTFNPAAATATPKHGTPPGDPTPVPPTMPNEPASNFLIGHDNTDGVVHNKPLVTFELYGEANKSFYAPPVDLRETIAIDENSVIGNPITLMYGHSQPDVNGDVTFFIKANMIANPKFDPTLPITNSNIKMLIQPYPFSKVTPAIADKVFPNETKIIEITNMTGGDHNFHLHGFMFQLLDTRLEYDDAPEKNVTIPAPFIQNKDTILIPQRPGSLGISRSITRLIVSFTDTGRENQIFADGKIPTVDSSGGWIMHCHFLEHSDKGMMSYIQVTR